MGAPGSAAIKAIARHRLTHFALIAFVLALLIPEEHAPAPTDPTNTDQLVVDEGTIVELLRQATRDGSEPLDDDARRRTLDIWITNELLVQEARRLGLDTEDPAIRKRMSSSLLESVARSAALVEPASEDDMRAYFEKHKERFAGPPTASFRFVHIPAPTDAGPDPLSSAREQARGLLDALRDEGRSEPPDVTIKQSKPVTHSALSTALGDRVANAVWSASIGQWEGPVATAHGFYLLHVDARTTQSDASFEEVRERVRAAVQAEREGAERVEYVRGLATTMTLEVRIPKELQNELGEYRFSPDEATLRSLSAAQATSPQ